MLLVSLCVPVITWLCNRAMRFQSRPTNWPLLTIESPVAQWLEHPTRSRRVVGSNPIWDSDFFRGLYKFNIMLLSFHLYYTFCFGGDFIFALVGYEMIIANSVVSASLGIYYLISNARWIFVLAIEYLTRKHLSRPCASISLSRVFANENAR